MVTFLRRDSNRFGKLGKKRKSKQVWRRPTGRDNKMREKRRGYPAVVSIGHKTDSKSRGLIQDKTPVRISNLKDFEKLDKNSIAIIGKVGDKRKLEIAKKALEIKVEISNLNVKKFIKEMEKKFKPVKEKKK